jgi:hypothetical protein
MPGSPSAAASLSACACLLAACVEVDRRSGAVTLHTRTQLLAGSVDPAGADLVRPAGAALHPRVRLSVPPGAVAAPVDVAVFVRYGDERFPAAVQVFEIEPAGVEFLHPARLTIDYGEVYARATASLLAEHDTALFGLEGPDDDDRYCAVLERDVDANAITAAIERSGTYYPLHPTLYALLYQRARCFDPGRATATAAVGGRVIAVRGGPQETRVGVGGLDDFFASGPADNVLVLHGLLGAPFDVSGDASLVPVTPGAGYGTRFRNVVAYQFPSGRSIAANGNALYDHLMQRRGPGFGTHVVAHSVGGLVARWALERAHLDPARAGFHAGDPPLSDVVESVVFVGTPNQGSEASAELFGELLRLAREEDLEFLDGVVELAPGPESFTERLNAGWSASRTQYFAIAGDRRGASNDGVVGVDSAIGLPTAPGALLTYLVFSGPAYDHHALAVFAARTGIVDQSLEWLAADAGNTAPVVGSLHTPTRVVRSEVHIEFRLADAEADPCDLVPEFRREGEAWLPATAAAGSGPYLQVPSEPAPGRTLAFVWDTAADGFEVGSRARVRVRIGCADLLHAGTPGETGWFWVEN